jgi:hypothetical protein
MILELAFLTPNELLIDDERIKYGARRAGKGFVPTRSKMILIQDGVL